MVSYRSWRIKFLKGLAVQAFENLPEECRRMSMTKLMKYHQELLQKYFGRQQPRHPMMPFSLRAQLALRKIESIGQFGSVIDYLVDLGEIDFDESTPVEEIVKMLREGEGS